ncbi:MAG TPA: OsmC family protein [Chitinophagaceae bacterium]|nr:OsmC family protein [Chitinophagaceae bacterium]
MKITFSRIDDQVNMEALDENGHRVQMDASTGQGGNNQGVRPMQMLIMGLGGCSSIDVITILKKQKQEIRDIKIQIDADREAGREPSLWEKIHLIFQLEGRIDPGKANRAVELSMMKYCSVAETLRRAGAAITWEVQVKE